MRFLAVKLTFGFLVNQYYMSLIDELLEYGLTAQETKVYLSLAQLAEAKVSELAKHSGVERSECYQILKKLHSRGLVRMLETRPYKFRSYPPNIVVSQLIKEKVRDVELLERGKKDIVDNLEEIAKVRIADTPEGQLFQDIVKITGKENILLYANRLIEKCQERGITILSARGVKGGLNILKKWQKIIREKQLKIRILATITEDNIKQTKQLAKFTDVRHLDGIRSRMSISDNAEILITLSEEADLPTTAMFIKSEDQMRILFELFDAAWEISTPLQLRIYQLEKKIKIGESKALKGEEQVSGIVKDMLKRADTYIMLLADSRFIREILPFVRSKIIPKTQAGKLKMIILTDSYKILTNLRNTLNLELRYFENPRSRIIITENESLIGTLSKEKFPIEAVWSNHNGIVNVMKDITKTHLEKSIPFSP